MAKKKQTGQEAAGARGRMRARREAERAAADSAATAAASDKTALAAINTEIQGMVTSGASQVRPGKLKELQAQGKVIATRMRGRRRAKKST